MNLAALAFLGAAAIVDGGAPALRPKYEPPAAVSYQLPVVQRVGDHLILDEGGAPTTLFTVKGGRLAVVSFMYTACSDVQGCPLATAALHRLDAAVSADPVLRERVALLSVSFDPERDKPAHLAAVRTLWRASGRWRFLTARDEVALGPILADYDQPVARLVDETGSPTPRLRHVLKVYLVDEGNAVRNIYSTGFLDPVLVLNDIRTLLAE